MHIPFAIVDSRNTTYRNVEFSAAPKLRECAEICHPSAQCIPMRVEGKLTIADSSAPALTPLSYLCACPSPHGYPISSTADVAMNGTASSGCVCPLGHGVNATAICGAQIKTHRF